MRKDPNATCQQACTWWEVTISTAKRVAASQFHRGPARSTIKSLLGVLTGIPEPPGLP